MINVMFFFSFCSWFFVICFFKVFISSSLVWILMFQYSLSLSNFCFKSEILSGNESGGGRRAAYSPRTVLLHDAEGRGPGADDLLPHQSLYQEIPGDRARVLFLSASSRRVIGFMALATTDRTLARQRCGQFRRRCASR